MVTANLPWRAHGIFLPPNTCIQRTLIITAWLSFPRWILGCHDCCHFAHLKDYGYLLPLLQLLLGVQHFKRATSIPARRWVQLYLFCGSYWSRASCLWPINTSPSWNCLKRMSWREALWARNHRWTLCRRRMKWSESMLLSTLLCSSGDHEIQIQAKLKATLHNEVKSL